MSDIQQEVLRLRNVVGRLGGLVELQEWECSHGVLLTKPCDDCGFGSISGELVRGLEDRVADWIRTRIGEWALNRKERAMRLLEESLELAQSEQITLELWQRKRAMFTNARKVNHSKRPAG